MGQDEGKICTSKNRAVGKKEVSERAPKSKLRSWRKNGLDKVIEAKKDKSKKRGQSRGEGEGETKA